MFHSCEVVSGWQGKKGEYPLGNAFLLERQGQFACPVPPIVWDCQQALLYGHSAANDALFRSEYMQLEITQPAAFAGQLKAAAGRQPRGGFR